MSSRFIIAGNTTQINFRYRCREDFSAETVDGEIHTFPQKTILRIDELYDDYAILTYTTFPQRKKIILKVTQDFEHIDKFVPFST
jgi:hypothetical protein